MTRPRFDSETEILYKICSDIMAIGQLCTVCCFSPDRCKRQCEQDGGEYTYCVEIPYEKDSGYPPHDGEE